MGTGGTTCRTLILDGLRAPRRLTCPDFNLDRVRSVELSEYLQAMSMVSLFWLWHKVRDSGGVGSGGRLRTADRGIGQATLIAAVNPRGPMPATHTRRAHPWHRSARPAGPRQVTCSTCRPDRWGSRTLRPRSSHAKHDQPIKLDHGHWAPPRSRTLRQSQDSPELDTDRVVHPRVGGEHNAVGAHLANLPGPSPRGREHTP